MTSTLRIITSTEHLRNSDERRRLRLPDGRWRPRRHRPHTILGSPRSAIPFLGPAVLGVLLLLLIPFVWSIYRSFMGNGSAGFVGFDNYVTMFQDPNLQLSLLNTFIWAIGSLLLPVVFGLGVAVMTSAMKLGAIA